MRRDLRVLESLVARLPLFGTTSGVVTPVPTGPTTKRVFVVHGQADAARLHVVRFLEATATDFEVQVLSEAVNRGRTIIEKVEEEGGAATYAVVLLTGDDMGGPKGQDAQRPRGRQNVVLEMGYFFGKLGREKVAILYEEGVELPSDTQGIAYIPWDAHGGWQMKLEKELRAASHHLNLQKVP